MSQAALTKKSAKKCCFERMKFLPISEWQISETNQVYLFCSSRINYFKTIVVENSCVRYYVDLEMGLFHSPSKNEPA